MSALESILIESEVDVQGNQPIIPPEFGDLHRKLFQDLIACAKKLNNRIFLVGGFVRDLMRGTGSLDADVDLLIEGDAIKFAELISGTYPGELKRFPDFYTAKLILKSSIGRIAEIDFASTRKETYPAKGSLPKVELSDLNGDLSRRDFSVNAMALELGCFVQIWERTSQGNIGDLIKDPFGGAKDLQRKLVRVLHAESFNDDPTRIFRSARYVARLNGDLEAETFKLLQTALRAGVLKSVSKQRILNEVRKALLETSPSRVFELLTNWHVIEQTDLFADCDVRTFLDGLVRLEQIRSPIQLDELGIALIYRLIPPEKREAALRLYGFGKASFKRWNTWIEQAGSKSELQEFDLAALLLKFALSEATKVEDISLEIDRRIKNG